MEINDLLGDMRPDHITVRADLSLEAIVISCADDDVELIIGPEAAIDLVLALIGGLDRLHCAGSWSGEPLRRLQSGPPSCG